MQPKRLNRFDKILTLMNKNENTNKELQNRIMNYIY